MPKYDFIRKDGTTFSEYMTISEMENFLKKNKDVDINFLKSSIGDPIRLGKTKPPDSFRSLLKKMKKENPRSNINTL